MFIDQVLPLPLFPGTVYLQIHLSVEWAHADAAVVVYSMPQNFHEYKGRKEQL